MKIKNLLRLLLPAVLLLACEKSVSFKLDDVSSKLVVEGTIENGTAPFIILSSSLAYFSAIDPATLAKSFVHHADVFISNGIKTHKLKEYARAIFPGDSLYYYSIDSSNLATAFIGELHTSYSLRVVAEGKEYMAVTNIPNITKLIDSLYTKQAPPDVSAEKVVLMVTATDPPGFGDYVRYFTKRNKEQFYAGINSVFDDQVIDGTTYTVSIDRGMPRESASGSQRFFYKGDTVTLKLSNIDRATYDFWRTMEFTYQSVGNPFSSPTRVLNNISNGGLGYFGGYASQFKTIIVPH